MANNEGYARLSNGLWRNTKIRKIARKDPQALADWIMAISFCSDKLSDGHLTEDDMLFSLGFDEESIGRLVGLGLLDQDDRRLDHPRSVPSTCRTARPTWRNPRRTRAKREARSRRRNTETTEDTQSRVTETDVTCDSRVTFNQNQNQNQNQNRNSLTPIVAERVRARERNRNRTQGTPTSSTRGHRPKPTRASPTNSPAKAGHASTSTNSPPHSASNSTPKA